MYALPLATTTANDAVRRQFTTGKLLEPLPPEPRPSRIRPSRIRLALAAMLDRAAVAIAPAGYRPAH